MVSIAKISFMASSSLFMVSIKVMHSQRDNEPLRTSKKMRNKALKLK